MQPVSCAEQAPCRGAEAPRVAARTQSRPDAQGARLSVLWQREVDARVVDAQSFRDVAARGLDDPRTFAAYLHAQRWSCVTSTRPRLFQAPHRAGIELHAYQLEPLRKALLPRVNLFIADDVGLGKAPSIEAATRASGDAPSGGSGRRGSGTTTSRARRPCAPRRSSASAPRKRRPISSRC